MLEDPGSAWTSTSYAVNGRPVTVLSRGTGDAVLFLHGTGTFPGFAFGETWAATRRVIVPYHPGFGGTDGETLGSVEEYVTHYIALLDDLGLAAVDLVGFSLGGWIAADLAARHPGRVKTLVLVAPAGLVDDDAPAPDMADIPPEQVPGYLTHDPRVALSHFPQAPDPAFGARLGKEMAGFAKLVRDHPQGDPTLAGRLGRITAPTLLVWGAEDRLRPTAQARSWQRRIPTCRLETVQGTGHLVFEEAPQAASLILDVLDHKGR